MNAPKCEKCQFFRPGRYARTGQCTRYIAYRGRGKVVYEWADDVRFSEHKCGPDGRLFVVLEKKESRERQQTILHLLNDDE
jgi:hypothetical protein